MENQDFIRLLEDYREKTSEEWQEIAKRLGVTRATISNWRNGAVISMKNRNGILVLTGHHPSNRVRINGTHSGDIIQNNGNGNHIGSTETIVAPNRNAEVVSQLKELIMESDSLSDSEKLAFYRLADQIK